MNMINNSGFSVKILFVSVGSVSNSIPPIVISNASGAKVTRLCRIWSNIAQTMPYWIRINPKKSPMTNCGATKIGVKIIK